MVGCLNQKSALTKSLRSCKNVGRKTLRKDRPFTCWKRTCRSVFKTLQENPSYEVEIIEIQNPIKAEIAPFSFKARAF